MSPSQTPLRRQRGAVLIVSLLILLVMTIIGITAMQSTTLQERMAGNARDRNLALQAAESGLKDATDLIEGLANTAAFTGSQGLYGTADTVPDPFVSSSWSDSKSRAGKEITGTAAAPRYYIKLVSTTSMAGGRLNIQGYGKTSMAGGTLAVFQITVRGTGGSENAQSVVRSYYGKIF
jgi:type IV pilus assembly protein PilX